MIPLLLVQRQTVVISIIFLNVLQYILKTLYVHWEIGANILHPGLFLVDGYHFFSYFWIDLMFGLFLFGVPFLLYSFNFRLGIQKASLFSCYCQLFSWFYIMVII